MGSISIGSRGPVSVPAVQAQTQAAERQRKPWEDQQHPPGSCGNSDIPCFQKWYDEYRAAMTAEFMFWRDFENDVASRSSARASLALNSAIDSGRYRHATYTFTENRHGGWKSVSYDDIDSLWQCKTAIVLIKHMLIDVRSERDLDVDDPKQYLSVAKDCERGQKIKPPRSALRIR